MKATVIKLNCGGILSDIEVEYYNRGAAAQAEISFKAGYEAGFHKAAEFYPAAEKKGRNEVVGWIREGGYLMGDKWEAKVKEEWGIEK